MECYIAFKQYTTDAPKNIDKPWQHNTGWRIKCQKITNTKILYSFIKYKFKYKIHGYIESGIHIFPHPQTETSHLSKNFTLKVQIFRIPMV